MFGEALGGRRGGGRARAGADIRTQVEIELTDAFTGVKLPVNVPTRIVCEHCAGTGSESKDRAGDKCPTCGGAGKVRAQQGFFLVERACPTCGGAGRVVRNPCTVCQGAGTVGKQRELSVQIPAGVEDGTRIRLAGEGEAGPQGTPPGDLYVHVAIRPSELFQREGANIFCRVPIRLTQAAIGGEVEVPVIDGSRTRVKIPAGTQGGEQFRLRGKGFSILAQRRPRRHVYPGLGRDPAPPHQAAARAARGVRTRGLRSPDWQSRQRGLLRPHARLFRWQRGLTIGVIGTNNVTLALKIGAEYAIVSLSEGTFPPDGPRMPCRRRDSPRVAPYPRLASRT